MSDEDNLPAEASTKPTIPASLESLFSSDPNDWTNEDIEKVTLALRSQRRNFVLADDAKQALDKKPKKLTTLPAGTKPSLASLGLLEAEGDALEAITPKISPTKPSPPKPVKPAVVDLAQLGFDLPTKPAVKKLDLKDLGL